jgi:acyl-homoserine lactone synthase
MAIIITSENEKAYARELDMAFRFRHEFFVEGLGWEALRRPDGREIDEFDTEDTVHIVEIVDDKVLYYSRLLPSMKPHPLSHRFRELLGGREEPVGPDIWEGSRASLVARRLPNGKPNPVAGRITLATVEAAMFIGATRMLIVTHPLLLTRMLDHGYRPMPLGVPVELYGGPLVAALSTIDMFTLETTRRFYDVWSPVATYNGRPVLDLLEQRRAA